MIGSVIIYILEEIEISKVIATFTKLCHEDEISEESIVVGVYLLAFDMNQLRECNTGEDLEKIVLGIAKMNGQYAGLDYNPDDFLDPENEAFSAPDDGLSWVGFADLLALFQKTVDELTV